ncbi:MAG: BACON domain-containing protein [Firmicutes bacterium]|nr:BACON domain-containing protein [[Eubacterium] siraeum]MCM1488264.1 BACON domain-containing protein [Bacillota bacterium]
MSFTVYPSSLSLAASATSSTLSLNCQDLSWTVKSNQSWCTAEVLTKNSIRVSVAENTGAQRTAILTITYRSDTVNVNVTQAAAKQVYYNLDHLMRLYQQPTEYSCAFTCACMCVMHTPADVENAGYNPNNADWTGIGEHYNYTVSSDPPAQGTIKNVFETLKAGYPVIAKIHDPDLNTKFELPHWVVVTRYSGYPDNYDSAKNYFCADPKTGKFVNLANATNYTGVYRYAYYKKK